jgi:hypothetical protein
MTPEIKPLKDKKFRVSYCKSGITKGLPVLIIKIPVHWFWLMANCYE